jgi:hypothetical protein
MDKEDWPKTVLDAVEATKRLGLEFCGLTASASISPILPKKLT